MPFVVLALFLYIIFPASQGKPVFRPRVSSMGRLARAVKKLIRCRL
jgi:hypothetical protein